MKSDGTFYPHWWYRFRRNGVCVRVNTKQGDKKIAKELENEHESKLARGEHGLRDWRDMPTLTSFEKPFMTAIESECGKGTAKFYEGYYASLLAFAPLANARLDQIDEALIEKFVMFRKTQVAHPERKGSTKLVAPGTVNRSLATLRRALRKAQERRIIDRVPRIRLNLKGERNREFVLPRDREAEYVNECPELLRDLAVFILYTGLRVGEATRLTWADVHPDPVGSAKYGYVQIREGKSENAKRTVPLLPRLVKMLKARSLTAVDQFVFTQCAPTYLCRLHGRAREKMGLPADAVIHSLRHTLLTRLAEVGTDIGTLKEIAGHARSSVTERYVHPSSESKERAFDKLEAAYPEIAAGVQELHMKASRRAKKARK